MKKSAVNHIISLILNTCMILFSLTCIYPIIWILSSSLKVKREFNADIISLPENPTLINFQKIITNPDYHILASLGNSFLTTSISVFFIALFGFIVGYLLARVRFRGNKMIGILLLMGMLIPIHSLLVPIYVVFNRTGLSNHWYTLIFPYIAFGLPIAVFLVQGYVKEISIELEEAAAIDGCGFSRTMFQIIMPICRPVMIAIAIIEAFNCWNEFPFALVLLKDARLHTVPLAMTQFTGQFSSDYPQIMAAMLITMAPIVILYFAFNKLIIKGMVAGAVKG
ncbi:carbohydrate ABC transporter permease [Oscillospiraceae bacterium PP1C4]